MSSICGKISKRKYQMKYILIGNIRRRLVAYPFLYKLIYKVYHRIRSLLPIIEVLTRVAGVSHMYISQRQGFLRMRNKGSEESFRPLRPFRAHYENDQDFNGYATDIKPIAYHLPQFHTIPENDEWWGCGFTEWTNTKKATPLFPGHYQPREPHDDIGYYDLTNIDVLKRQVEMAQKHGIYGFCFYHYWFHGKRLLGKPVDLLLEHPEINMPFCLCWANETWSKKWDGHEHHILIQQTFSPEDDLQFIEFLRPFLQDPRYIRVNSKPMLMVYRISKLPNPLETTKRWRNWARENGLGELYLVSICHGDVFPHVNLKDIGFDAYAGFPPHSFPCQHVPGDKNIFGTGYRFDYGSGVDAYSFPEANTPIYQGCTLGWDNTARLGRNATIYLNFSLTQYDNWLRKTINYTRAKFRPEERFVFINAWNEWAEGAYLEPDKKFGYAYLNTTSRALFNIPSENLEQYEDIYYNDSASRYTKNYEWMKYLIENQGEYTLAAINRFIKQNSCILEFGPSSGYFTRYLKEEKNAIVDIVEIDKVCAESAAKYARDCFIGDIEQYLWKEAYASRMYDFIIFADVLEHLRDPWNVLSEVLPLLNPDGRVLISLPNIAHVQIIASLYNNDFSYANSGILDKSHLRFFTEPTVRQMIQDAGLHLCELIPIQAPILPQGCGTRWNRSNIPAKFDRLLSKKQHAYTMQFVACCQKS